MLLPVTPDRLAIGAVIVVLAIGGSLLYAMRNNLFANFEGTPYRPRLQMAIWMMAGLGLASLVIILPSAMTLLVAILIAIPLTPLTRWLTQREIDRWRDGSTLRYPYNPVKFAFFRVLPLTVCMSVFTSIVMNIEFVERNVMPPVLLGLILASVLGLVIAYVDLLVLEDELGEPITETVSKVDTAGKGA